MQSKKPTPLEILQKQKIDLQVKSDALSAGIENHVKYLQQNFVPLLRAGLMEPVISKIPPPLQNLIGLFFPKEKQTLARNTSGHKTFQMIAGGIAEITPFFVKGKKGVILSIILKKISKWIN